jgi:lysophospholipase L1-like esterase
VTSGRAPAVEPYLRGCPWPAAPDAPYPRADPADASRLPNDTWAAATIPACVRLELIGDAEAVELSYRTTTNDLGYRGASAGTTFSVWCADECIDDAEAVLGTGTVRLRLGSVPTDSLRVIHFPEGMKPEVLGIEPIGGDIAPAPPRPRWVAYGDSILEGWVASEPGRAWPAVVTRRHGIDCVNMGYAGAARGEIVSAQQIASLTAAVISVTHGTNCWTRVPHSVGQMRENTLAFLTLVRAGHPEVPIVVSSPVLRPDAEATPNALGATLGDLRDAMEVAVRELIDAGDDLIRLVPGLPLLDASHLADGIHPGDAGHARLADALGPVLASAVSGAVD